MINNSFENGQIGPDNNEENKAYRQYYESGGIINEKDYESAITRAKDTITLDKTLIQQAKNIADFAGIDLHNTQNVIDPRIILYGILRRDVRPEKVKRHHDEMCDQRIFAEALRMSEDIESLHKMIKAYPNISFIYRKEDDRQEKVA